MTLVACQPVEQAPGTAPGTAAPATSAATSVAHVDGIHWFAGDLDAAFTTAASQGKLVFLYWGAEWCPPCHDLKAHVFPRQDFQRSLQQFVPVYLDGDAPGAQRVADEFKVQGYPSVVVLNPQRVEVARISGGSDLTSYAEVLDLALASTQPVDAVLASLRTDADQQLDAAQCRRLAWNDWFGAGAEPADNLPGLLLAAQRCPANAQADRDRLLVQAADVAATSQRAKIDKGGTPDAQLVALLTTVDQILTIPARRDAVATVLLYLAEDFFVAVRHGDAVRARRVRENYFALLDAIETDQRQSDTVRLLSAARRLSADKALSGRDQPGDAVATRARTTLDAFLARDYAPDARAGIVNSASWVLSELGDDARLRTLLEEQMQRSRTAYYYMPDVADIEERAGNIPAALQWLEKGYNESKGPATRFQWGTLYVNGLLRMTPQDEPRIRAAVLAVLGELQGADRIHARARVRLERLDAALEEWAMKTNNAATLKSVAQRWQQICGALAVDDPARTGCSALLG